ncbi:MAG: GerMN domain-containing protein [Acidimicrobiales bacterium]|jgi:hypothetical protein
MRRIALAVLCAIAVLAGACGIPYDRAPQSLPLDQLPAQLTKPVEPAPPTTSPARPGRETVADLYYVENSLLAQFPTTIAANPASLDEVLRTLGAGPTIRDAGSGVRSYLPVGAITGLVSKGVAYIGLDPTYFELPPEEQALELGQIVFTVLGTFPSLKFVQFDYNGSAVAVLNGNEELVDGRVNESSYCGKTARGCALSKKVAQGASS